MFALDTLAQTTLSNVPTFPAQIPVTVSETATISDPFTAQAIFAGTESESFTLSGYAAAKDYSATRYSDSLLLTSGAGTTAGNYSITYSQGGLTINKAPLTVTGVTTTVTYNGVTQINNAATVTGKLGSDSIVVAGYASATNTGNYSDNLSVTSSAASNYNITYVSAVMTVTPAPIVVNATAVSMV